MTYNEMIEFLETHPYEAVRHNSWDSSEFLFTKESGVGKPAFRENGNIYDFHKIVGGLKEFYSDGWLISTERVPCRFMTNDLGKQILYNEKCRTCMHKNYCTIL